MSSWTYINGVITVAPLGNTQAQKRYILDTVLFHLPKVTGDEEDMHVEVIQEQGYTSSSSHDELGQRTNLGNGYRGSFETQRKYKLVIYGYLRNRMVKQTYKELLKWLCRLAKRVCVDNVLININDGWKENKTICYTDEFNNPFYEMFEDVSWVSNGESINWCEYLLPVYSKSKDEGLLDYPALLSYKYYNDKDNDEFVESILNIKE